jgi:hypothetical protein
MLENVEVKNFHRDTVFFFDDLVSLITALSSFDIAIEVHERCGNAPNSMKRDHSINLYGRFVTYSWNPYFTLACLSNDEWPNTLTLAKLPPYSPATKSRVELKETGISSFINSTCGLTFMLYFERIKPIIKAKYSEPSNWPELFNFCRIVRNSIAHGGKIYFQSSNSAPLKWNDIKICHIDNNEVIFQPQKYIGVGDLILLIEECDHLLTKTL